MGSPGFSSITGVLSGGWFDPQSPDYQALGIENEQRRQGRINSGMSLINAIYGGGTADVYSLAPTKAGGPGYQPGMDYRQNGKGEFVPINTQGRFNRASRGFNAFTKTPQTFQGFQPSFFDKRAQAYVDYAMPQLAQQYKTTRDATTFNLANRGLSDSSVSGQEYSNVDRQLALAKQGVVDTAHGQAQDLLKQVENSRQNAIQTLYNTGSPSQAANSAIGDYYNLQQPSIYGPLANSFSNIVRDYQTNQILNNFRGTNYNSAYNPNDASAGALPNPTYGSG